MTNITEKTDKNKKLTGGILFKKSIKTSEQIGYNAQKHTLNLLNVRIDM